MAACLDNYDDSAYRQARSSVASAEGHQQAPLIVLDPEDGGSGCSSGKDGHIAGLV